MANRWGNSGNSGWLYFLGLQNHCKWWLQPWIKRCLLLGRKAMTNWDSILKSRDISLPTQNCIIKAILFPVVIYGCESWTLKKAECQKIDALELQFWKRLLKVLWTAISNQSILKEINPECSQEAPILWPLEAKSQLTGKDVDVGKDWRQEEKWVVEDEIVGWYHWLDGHEFEQTPGDSEGQGSFACYSLCGLKESNMTEWLNNNKDKNTQKSTDEVFVILKLAV